MADTPTNPATAPQTDTEPACPVKQGISMHENIPDWYDCCTCEAEPYWIEAFAVEEEKAKAD